MCKDVYGLKRDWQVRETDDTIFLAIEGTDCIEDWKTNFAFLFRSDDTHRGFRRNAWRVFFEMFEADVFRHIPKDKHIVVTGHSLGGATAIVLADMLDNVFDNVEVVTFGSPRPGGRGLRKRMKGTPITRYVHGSDVVPKSPPWACGYVHPCECNRLTDTQKQRFDGVKDHSMSEYIKALDSL